MTHRESIFGIKGGNLLECDMRLGRYGKLTDMAPMPLGSGFKC